MPTDERLCYVARARLDDDKRTVVSAPACVAHDLGERAEVLLPLDGGR